MTSKILNRGHRVKRSGLAGRLQPSPTPVLGGDEVAYIIAWTLGPPVSLIILFLLLFGA